ncbi:hypothetical protein RJ640_019291 [Escallonia rubra]|uniref:J domain-containing protein n=1 Tax=Escallonia rubra TaxID=112253 RepID=A0AA88QT39_9ASTE|nr:hypothetical protein RJ640_019291 [Escallonia rubra]
MSPAVAGFQPPITSHQQKHSTQPPPSQNPNPNPRSQNPSSSSLHLENASDGGFNCSNFAGRSRPRLMKTRKKSGSPRGRPASRRVGLNPFRSVSEISISGVEYAATSNCKKTGVSTGEEGFVFGASNLTSEQNGFSGKVGSNVGFVFGGNNFNVRQKAFFGSVENLEGGESAKVGNLGFVFSANESDSVSSLEKIENVGFVFGVDKNKLDLAANITFGNKESGDVAQRDSLSKSHFGEDGSSGNVGTTVPAVRGNLKLDAIGDSGKLGDASFVFSTGWSDSRSNSNQEAGRSVLSEYGNMGSMEQRAKFDNVGFVFGANERDTKSSVLFKSGEFERSGGKLDSETRIEEAKENDVFVFGSANKGDSGLSGSFQVSDWMNKSKSENAENCNGYMKRQNDNTDLLDNTKFDSVYRTSSSLYSDDIGASKISDALESLKIYDSVEVDGVDTIHGSTKTAGLFGGSVGNFSGKRSSSCSTSGTCGKENQPINLTEKSSRLSQFSENRTNNGSEMNKTSFSSQASSMGIGLQPQGNVFGASHLDGVEKDKLSVTNTPVGSGMPFTSFTAPSLNTPCSFSANFFPGLSKKLEFSAKSRSVGRRKAKKTGGNSRQHTLVQQSAAENLLSKEGHTDESLGSCSPMDFSPYQEVNCVPRASHSAVSAKPKEQEPNSSKEGGRGFLSSPKSDKSDGRTNFCFASTSVNCGDRQSSFVTLSSPQDNSSASKHQQMKKYRMKIGRVSKVYASSQNVDISKSQSKWKNLCKADEAHVKQDPTEAGPVEACEKLRISCHLVLGEVEDAMQYFSNCLQSGIDVCLDRRITIEAAGGLQKAQKVVECMNSSAELLQQRTPDAASNALEIIAEALSISCYSEKLLQMKGAALFMLRKYEEVVKLCEQSLDFAERNFATLDPTNQSANADGSELGSSLRLWRWSLMSKSYFHLGRLEVALDYIEKQEQLNATIGRCGSWNQETTVPLAITVRELLRQKNAGNEAFQFGRHTEAVEHYTAAISCSVESRPFTAVCFCNRAAAHQALGQIADAIADCSLAIALDENYSKALSRRATLHEMIRDYEQAANDLHRLISVLEKRSQKNTQQSGTPDSREKDLRRARRRVSSMQEKAKKGIPLDLYCILGIKASDASSEIKKAYRKAALRHHPDKAGQFLARSEGGDDGLWKEITDKIHISADKLFKMIGEAYAVLSDPTKVGHLQNYCKLISLSAWL